MRLCEKIGLIGAGQMAEWHIRGFRAAGAEVVAVADMNVEKGGEFARRNGIAGGAYPDLPSMLTAHPELQAVSVITPNLRRGRSSAKAAGALCTRRSTPKNPAIPIVIQLDPAYQ